MVDKMTLHLDPLQGCQCIRTCCPGLLMYTIM